MTIYLGIVESRGILTPGYMYGREPHNQQQAALIGCDSRNQQNRPYGAHPGTYKREYSGICWTDSSSFSLLSQSRGRAQNGPKHQPFIGCDNFKATERCRSQLSLTQVELIILRDGSDIVKQGTISPLSAKVKPISLRGLDVKKL